MSKKLLLVYTANAGLAQAYVKKGHLQRNPTYFEGPERDVESVVVIGDFPNIVEAYEAVEGCSVKAVKEPAKGKAEAKAKGPTKAEKEAAAKEAEAKRLQDERDAQRKEIEEADESALKELLIGLETEKDGSPHVIAAEDLADLDVETLRSMAIETIFVGE